VSDHAVLVLYQFFILLGTKQILLTAT